MMRFGSAQLPTLTTYNAAVVDTVTYQDICTKWCFNRPVWSYKYQLTISSTVAMELLDAIHGEECDRKWG